MGREGEATCTHTLKLTLIDIYYASLYRALMIPTRWHGWSHPGTLHRLEGLLWMSVTRPTFSLRRMFSAVFNNYVFNLVYEKQTKEVALFLQEYFLGQANNCKTRTYLFALTFKGTLLCRFVVVWLLLCFYILAGLGTLLILVFVANIVWSLS